MSWHSNDYSWEESSIFCASTQEISVERDQALKFLKKQRNFDNHLQLFSTQMEFLSFLITLWVVGCRDTWMIIIDRKVVSFEQTLKKIV